MIGYTICGKVHQKQSARKVTYPSTIATLGRLTLEFPWVLGFKDLGGLNLPVPDKKQSVSRYYPPRDISADARLS